MPRPLSTGKWEIFAHKNWNLLLPCLSIFIAVPNRFANSDENIWGHFLAEGFGEILQVNPKVFVHWHLGTGSMPPANFVDTSCKIRKLLVDASPGWQWSQRRMPISAPAHKPYLQRGCRAHRPPSALVTIVYWYSGKCSSIQYALHVARCLSL